MKGLKGMEKYLFFFVDEFFQGLCGKIFFELGGKITDHAPHQTLIKRANMPVERALRDIYRAFNGFVDIQEGNVFCIYIQYKSTTGTSD